MKKPDRARNACHVFDVKGTRIRAVSREVESRFYGVSCISIDTPLQLPLYGLRTVFHLWFPVQRQGFPETRASRGPFIHPTFLHRDQGRPPPPGCPVCFADIFHLTRRRFYWSWKQGTHDSITKATSSVPTSPQIHLAVQYPSDAGLWCGPTLRNSFQRTASYSFQVERKLSNTTGDLSP